MSDAAPASTPPGPSPAPIDDSADLFDYALIRDWVGYGLRSVLRHKLVALTTMLATLGAAVGALKALPKTYHVETKLLAQRNGVMNALGNPNRNVPGESDAPTRAASETVLRRDNLVLLIKQTDLVDNWERTRAPAVRLKDWAMQLALGEPNDDDRVEALVGLLEKRLTVETGDQTVTIAIDWPDGQTAFRLVDAAEQNFLESRHVTEIAIISEAISILEGHATDVHETIVSTMDDLQRQTAPAEKEGSKAEKEKEKPAAVSSPPRHKPEDQETAQLRVMLSSKRQTIKDVEEFRQRRLTELQSQLTEAKAVYAAAHPTVVNIQQTIDALSQESPQVTELKKDAAELEQDLSRREAKTEAAPEAPRHEVAEAIKLTRKSVKDGDDLNVEYTRSRLKLAIDQYDTLLERIDAARIELDTARAAFKYRYSVIRPAQVPKQPIKPRAWMVLAAGFVLSIVFALACALLLDLRSGKIIERWQVQRLLELQVLGEVHRS